MENVQAAISAPSPVPAKTSATEASADAEGAPLPGAFLAALSHQVKNLKCAAALNEQGSDPNAHDADADLDATDAKLPAEPAAVDLSLLVALPPALPPRHLATASDAAASALAKPLSSEPGPTQMVAARPLLTPGDAKPSAAAASGNAADAPEPRAMPARDPLSASTPPGEAAHELLRTAERTPSNGADRRENNAQTVPQLTFTQVLSDARSASTLTPVAHLQVDALVGAVGWGTELGQRVVWMVGEKQHVAELRVNPPDLGPLDIKLTIDDHQTTAVFTSPHSSVRDAIESALPRLREVLAESGIMLGNASVTADSPHDGSAFSQPPAPTPAATRDKSARDAAMHLAPGASGTVRGRGLVDLFA